MDEKIYKEVYHNLKKKGTTKISLDKYMDKMKDRNQAIKKKEYEQRRIKL